MVRAQHRRVESALLNHTSRNGGELMTTPTTRSVVAEEALDKDSPHIPQEELPVALPSFHPSTGKQRQVDLCCRKSFSQ